jgi:hypothetical protein
VSEAARGLCVTLLLAGAGLCPGAASAQDDQAAQREMQRSSMERDRQSDAFTLQLQQQQRELLAPAESRTALQQLHTDQRGRFEQLLDEQRTAVRNANIGSPAWGPSLDASPQMERERRMTLDRAARESATAR